MKRDQKKEEGQPGLPENKRGNGQELKQINSKYFGYEVGLSVILSASVRNKISAPMTKIWK